MSEAGAMADPRVKALVEKIQRRAEVAQEAKNVAKDYRERIEVFDSEISLIAEEIRTGQKTIFGDVTHARAAKDGTQTTVTLSVPGMEPVTADLETFKAATAAAKATRDVALDAKFPRV